MRSMLSQLHQKLNGLSPANTLPSSVLQRVFLILSFHEPFPNATWPTRARESHHWTKVLNVCRNYRNAALSCPSLWTSPPLSLGSARFNAFMTRSQDSPIDILLTDAGDLPAALLCEALQEPENLCRMRRLETTVPLGKETLQALTGSVPFLETLRIAPSRSLPEQSSMVLPENLLLLGNQAPRLRVLALRGFAGCFPQTAILSNVVSLNIGRGVNEDTYTRPLWPALLAVLGSLASIQELTLHGCLPKATQPPRGASGEALHDESRASKRTPVDSKHRALELLGSLCLPLHALRTLYLGAEVATSSQQITQVPTFSHCTQLASVYSAGITAKSLIKALEHPALFPELHRLIITRDLDIEEDYKEELMITWKVLLRTLTARKDAGFPVHYIALPSETLKEYWTKRMEDTGVSLQAVEDVNADGSQEQNSL